jgi:DNA modification methylase
MAEIEHIGQLLPDPHNARAHNPRNLGVIEDALKEVGAARSIVIDEDGVILAGNGVVEAAASAGIKRVQVVDADGETIVAVRRRGLSQFQKQRLALFDNRASDTSEFDLKVLAGLRAEDERLLAGLWNSEELDELLAQSDDGEDEPVEDPGAQVDRAEELREKWGTERGQIWQVGRHRLMCGDSTSAEDVARLMAGAKADMVYTDPPYGVGYNGGAKKRDELAGDELGTTIYADALPNLRQAAADHASLYLWYADAHAAAAAAAAAGYSIVAQIIWVKNNAQFVTSAHYKGKHEPCFYGHRKGKTARWTGPNNEVTVWECDRAQKNEWHPTQKPPELAARAMGNSSKEGDTVLDLFGGSGSTMVAAEQTGRACYAMEIEPKYVAVALERMSEMGLEPRLLPV